MASTPPVDSYIIIDPNDPAEAPHTSPSEDGARKIAEELAVNRDRPVYVYQKIGRMTPVHTAKWEGPGN